MEIKSLGIKTDLHINKFSGDVIDRGDYLVVYTPSNPGYWFGNYIIFDKPPQKNDFQKWRGIFIKEIYEKNKSEHMLFRWDTVTGEKGILTDFRKNNFAMDEDVLLSATKINKPLHYNSDITIRILKTKDDWEMSIQNQILCNDKSTGESLADHEVFKRKQMHEYCLMCEQGLCKWYGVFIKDLMVADMGVFLVDGVGHFQDVGTAPEFRRRGICGTAIYEISNALLDSKKINTMMMTADENYHAARIYESVGFKPSERSVCLLNPQYFVKNNN